MRYHARRGTMAKRNGSMTPGEGGLIFTAALLAGALNGIAGGGSFLSFPALVFAGMPPIAANATSTVALWPGTLASVSAYRRELKGQPGQLWQFGVIGLVGGILGAWLLLHTSESLFDRLLPFLLLSATLLFTFSKPLTDWVVRQQQRGMVLAGISAVGLPLLQLAIATYGGFFGGGMGILLLATLALCGMRDINAMNAIKTVMTSFINGVAIVPFVMAGIISWPHALLMAVGAIAGGYGSAWVAQRLPAIYVRRFVIAVGFGMTLYFFSRA